jgi:hypothetical protein
VTVRSPKPIDQCEFAPEEMTLHLQDNFQEQFPSGTFLDKFSLTLKEKILKRLPQGYFWIKL